MECTVCGKPATCLVSIKSNNNVVVIWEGRCNDHKETSKRKLKKLLLKE